MKRAITTVVLAGLAILAVALLNFRGSLQHWANVPTQCWHTSLLLADGGAPTPPWPTKAQLVADGGAPTPPWPKLPGVQTLVADGGAPTPPWPPNLLKAQLLADGGAPTPPWPKLPATSQSA